MSISMIKAWCTPIPDRQIDYELFLEKGNASGPFLRLSERNVVKEKKEEHAYNFEMHVPLFGYRFPAGYECFL